MENLLVTNHLVFEQKFSIKKFTQLTEKYPDLRLERSKTGKTTIKPYLKFGDSKKLTLVFSQLGQWWFENREKGVLLNASIGIELPDSAILSPSCGWISEERLAQNPVDNEDDNFLKIAPDFIVEVKSKSDSLRKLKKKMSDSWIKNGVRLAWLIDPYKQKAYIYRTGRDKPEEIRGFDNQFLDGEDTLKNFKLELVDFKILATRLSLYGL